MFGNIVFPRKEGPHAPDLQEAFAAVHHSQFIYRHQIFATMSSDELKKAIKEILLR